LDYMIIQIINKIKPWGKEDDFVVIFDTFGTLGVIAVTTVLILTLIYFSSRKYLNVKPVELLRYEG